jgi:hypothetical protein
MSPGIQIVVIFFNKLNGILIKENKYYINKYIDITIMHIPM